MSQDELWEVILDRLILIRATRSARAVPSIIVGRARNLQNLLYQHVMIPSDARVSDLPWTHYDFGTTTAWLTDWKTKVLEATAKASFCRFIHDRARSRAFILGEERYVRVTRELSDYYIAHIRTMCNDAWREKTLKGIARKKEIKFRVEHYNSLSLEFAKHIGELSMSEFQHFDDLGKDMTTIIEYDRALDEEFFKRLNPAKREEYS